MAMKNIRAHKTMFIYDSLQYLYHKAIINNHYKSWTIILWYSYKSGTITILQLIGVCVAVQYVTISWICNTLYNKHFTNCPRYQFRISFKHAWTIFCKEMFLKCWLLIFRANCILDVISHAMFLTLTLHKLD